MCWLYMESVLLERAGQCAECECDVSIVFSVSTKKTMCITPQGLIHSKRNFRTLERRLSGSALSRDACLGNQYLKSVMLLLYIMILFKNLKENKCTLYAPHSFLELRIFKFSDSTFNCLPLLGRSMPISRQAISLIFYSLYLKVIVYFAPQLLFGTTILTFYTSLLFATWLRSP